MLILSQLSAEPDSCHDVLSQSYADNAGNWLQWPLHTAALYL